MTTAKAKADPHELARDSEVDLTNLLLKSERRAWLVAGTASVLALSFGIGLAVVGSIKTSVPYVFEVDKASGAVQLMSVGDESFAVSNQELVDKHWVNAYVTSREGYFYKLLQTDYDNVQAMSGEQVALSYGALWDGQNARDKVLGQNVTMKVDIISTTLNPDPTVGNRAIVRFKRTTQHFGRPAEAPEYFVATLAYEYKPKLFGKEALLVKNPLGFSVTQYRVDPEVSQAAPVAAPIAVPAPVVQAAPIYPVSQPSAVPVPVVPAVQ